MGELKPAENSFTYLNMCSSSFAQNVRVGMLVKVSDGEQIPADMACLYSSQEGNVAFIQTTNLDGESNLKMRNTVAGLDINNEKEILTLRGKIVCEAPNTSLTK